LIVRGQSLLLLFDIDGTLFREGVTPVGAAMSVALKEVHRVDTNAIRTQIATSGRTHGEIARAILLDAGVPATRIDALADEVRERCCEAWARMLPDDLSDAVLPGVRELLGWLAGVPDVKLGLLTGNYEAIAELKVAHSGLGGFFSPGQGAFGSDAEDRDALPAIARRRAGTPGTPYPRAGTIVIGDTPRDVACARADGVRCAAVASGLFGTDALIGAEAVVRDAVELRAALRDLGVGPGVSRPGG
jgi:phosphoglycolate phosphatase-like HAD superfamily hydrolase